jgi:hypothetical protein
MAKKVPRPANAFILYRQHHHPLVKAAHPEYHNNDICKFLYRFTICFLVGCMADRSAVLLGKRWKAESTEAKAHWKAKAEQIKREHALKHPDYQYAPRKPSEKKRRSAARRNSQATAVHQGGSAAAGTQGVARSAAAASQSNASEENHPVQPSPSPELEQVLRNHTDHYITGNAANRFLHYHGRRPTPVISVSIPPLISSAGETDPNSENTDTDGSWTDFDFDFEDYFIAGTA